MVYANDDHSMLQYDTSARQTRIEELSEVGYELSEEEVALVSGAARPSTCHQSGGYDCD
jgi:hypothetical protein